MNSRLFDKGIYQARRRRLKEQLGKGVILLLGNEESSMNYRDNLYPFRQDSSFLYFFGLDKPGLAGVIDIDNDQEIIYGRELTMDEIVWTGPQPSLGEQAAAAGITLTRGVEELTKDILSVRNAGRSLHFLPPYRPENVLMLSGWLGVAPASA
ncbi:MAG TPA: aminopeptidase P N-terminal domain-containing protein, partial [Puia sp.]|nr:aminopeptidase P N-terminal domain-containing protein [Puia sp.]